jgi:hypothetical protein
MNRNTAFGYGTSTGPSPFGMKNAPSPYASRAAAAAAAPLLQSLASRNVRWRGAGQGFACVPVRCISGDPSGNSFRTRRGRTRLTEARHPGGQLHSQPRLIAR